MSFTYLFRYSTATGDRELIEVHPCEARTLLDQSPGRWEYFKVSPDAARKAVKNGEQHMTALYVDMDGRVRRAVDG